MSRDLAVWWDGRITGMLGLDVNGDMQFAYDARWLSDAKGASLLIRGVA
jgi:hypothetical protein